MPPVKNEPSFSLGSLSIHLVAGVGPGIRGRHGEEAGLSALNDFLTGVRVVDLSRHLPGPLATAMLADMGAEIVKVEPPAGDELRSFGLSGSAGRSRYFDAVNSGKTSRRLDLKREEDRQKLMALVETADVVVESFRPGVLDRLGVGFAAMRQRNPGLICCALNGFGAKGPLAEQAGHDINYLALAGTFSFNGTATEPTVGIPPVADCSAALFALSAILGALYRRTVTGSGCEIDAALADAVMPLQLFQVSDVAATGTTAGPARALTNGGAACYRLYGTRDGRFVSLGALEPKFWQRFCEAAGRPDWLARHHDPLPQSALMEEVAALFAALTMDEANARFAPADCCFAPALTLAEALDSPHVVARGLVVDGADGTRQCLFPVHVDGMPPRPRPAFVDC